MPAVLFLAGDGIGPEVCAQAQAVLAIANKRFNLGLVFSHAAFGGAAIDASGEPLPTKTLDQVHQADGVLLGAVGGPKWDALTREKRPEAGLLRLRSDLGLFANLRPAQIHKPLMAASSLKAELLQNLDLLVVRELTGGLYFGEPRGRMKNKLGVVEAYNTMRYSETEIERIARVAFDAAMQRSKRLCSVDKANVLEVSVLWREVVNKVAKDYPDVLLTHLYVDNAAMQMIREPLQFDVLLTENLFGDVLSDLAAQLVGSIGLLASASLNNSGFGVYEPCHGSAPDIAGSNQANPVAAILSAALLLRYSLKQEEAAEAIEQAVAQVLDQGCRTADIATGSEVIMSCSAMGDSICSALST